MRTNAGLAGSRLDAEPNSSGRMEAEMVQDVAKPPPEVDADTSPNHGGPEAVSANDPVAPQTHDDGGSYAEADYSPAAQRSSFHQDQFTPATSTKREDRPDRESGFDGAQGYDGPAGPGSQ